MRCVVTCIAQARGRGRLQRQQQGTWQARISQRGVAGGIPVARQRQQIAVADALCYIFGTFGVIWFCSSLGPKLLRIDLKAEGARLEQVYGIEREKVGVTSAWRRFDLRAYLVQDNHTIAGKSVAQAESLFAPERLFIERIRRNGSLLVSTPETRLLPGDVIAVSGKSEVLLRVLDRNAIEQADREVQ